MIVEVADFKIAQDKGAQFEQAIAHGVKTVLSQAKGFISHQILACQETPSRYLLIVRWETLENHTKDFRESEAFTQWRSIIGPFFAEAPNVEHFDITDQS